MNDQSKSLLQKTQPTDIISSIKNKTELEMENIKMLKRKLLR